MILGFIAGEDLDLLLLLLLPRHRWAHHCGRTLLPLLAVVFLLFDVAASVTQCPMALCGNNIGCNNSSFSNSSRFNSGGKKGGGE